MSSKLKIAKSFIIYKITDQYQLIRAQSFSLKFKTNASISSFQLWSLCSILIPIILKKLMRKTGSAKFLCCRWHEIETIKTAKQRQARLKGQD